MKLRSYTIVFALLIAAPLIDAATLYVAPGGNDGNSGADWDNALATLSNGVAKATNLNDVILASNGTYSLSAPITINSNVTLRSWNNGSIDRAGTIIDGNRGGRCLYLNNTGALVVGFTITNGLVSGNATYGGGVYINYGTISNCSIVGNIATNGSSNGGGGGLYAIHSGSLATDCTISGNLVSNYPGNGGGGGIYLASSAIARNCVVSGNWAKACNYGGGGAYNNAATLDACVIANNVTTNGGLGGGVVIVSGGIVTNCQCYGNTVTASGGGGVYISGNSTLTDSTISNNFLFGTAGSYAGGAGIWAEASGQIRNCVIVTNVAAADKGGGLFLASASVTMTGCTIRQNRATTGGGIYIYQQTQTIRNCLIYSNSASSGGGAYLYAGTPSFVNCTIVNNAGIGLQSGGGALTGLVENSSIYFNTGSGGNSNYVDTWSQMCFSNCCTAPNPPIGANNITTNPQFKSVSQQDFRLSFASPCINAGMYETWMDTATDLQGRPRIYYGRVDIGSYEYFLNVKVNGIPIDRIKSINGLPVNRIMKINNF